MLYILASYLGEPNFACLLRIARVDDVVQFHRHLDKVLDGMAQLRFAEALRRHLLRQSERMLRVGLPEGQPALSQPHLLQRRIVAHHSTTDARALFPVVEPRLHEDAVGVFVFLPARDVQGEIEPEMREERSARWIRLFYPNVRCSRIQVLNEMVYRLPQGFVLVLLLSHRLGLGRNLVLCNMPWCKGLVEC